MLMQYGFNAPKQDAAALSRVDERGATVADVSTDKMHSPPPPRLSGAAREGPALFRAAWA
jgi:hypothetical protein